MTKPITELPAFMSDFGIGLVKILQQTAENIKTRMIEPGSPVVYPVDWDSEKQRKAFFASDGFGGGIPHHRVGVERLWSVAQEPLGATVIGKHPAAAISGFPEGWQSKITRNRWNNTTKVLFEELAKIPQEVSNLFTVISK